MNTSLVGRPRCKQLGTPLTWQRRKLRQLLHGVPRSTPEPEKHNETEIFEAYERAMRSFVLSCLALALILLCLVGCATPSGQATGRAPGVLRQVPPLLPEPPAAPTETKSTIGSQL